jgi:hypothetical protein
MKSFAALIASLSLAGCATAGMDESRNLLFSRLSALCGKAFEGRIASPVTEADASFAGKRLVMHVRECSADTIRVPFHVGEDRSRTWVVTRQGAALRLKHDHRHQDGSEDALTQYGGDGDQTILTGAGLVREEYPADDFSKALFARQKIPQSATNVWALEFGPRQTFAYELRRPGRFFRVEFDLTRPVAPPPPPWGSEASRRAH